MISNPDDLKERARERANESSGAVGGTLKPAPNTDYSLLGFSDDDEYIRWWEEHYARLEAEKELSRMETQNVVEHAEPKRIFYDSPKGLIPVYAGGTQNVRVPLFERKKDGHLGAVED